MPEKTGHSFFFYSLFHFRQGSICPVLAGIREQKWVKWMSPHAAGSRWTIVWRIAMMMLRNRVQSNIFTLTSFVVYE